MIYNIVIVADNGYIQHSAVMLCSLFESNKDKRFHIFLFTTDISKENESRLTKLISKYSNELDIKRILLDGISDLPVGMWTTFMYLKLFMPLELPADVERCLFLDGDMIIHDDIEALYQWNLNGKVIAAAEDNPDGELHKKRLGLQSHDVYINSGVMVCDIKAWRAMEVERPIFDYTRLIASMIMNEQDVIAKYFVGKIDILPIRWNMVTHYFLRVPKIYDKYLPTLSDARKHPGIIHFCAPIKPWFKDCNHPYGYLYRRYIKRTSWAQYQFPVYEHLTARQKFNKICKTIINRIGIYKDPMALIV